MAKNAVLENAAIAMLNAKCRTDDIEINHMNADSILCSVLAELGYDKLVKQYVIITNQK